MLLVAVALAAAAADRTTSSTAGAVTLEERPIHERIDLPSIAACGGCHQRVYEEWSRSLHHRAWTNANVLTCSWMPLMVLR